MVAPPSESLNTYYWDTIDYFAKKKASYNSKKEDDELEEKLSKLLEEMDKIEDFQSDYYDELDDRPIEETEGYQMIQDFLNKRKGTLH